MRIRVIVPSLFFLVSSLGFADPSDLLVVKMTPRIVEQDQSVSWEQSLSQTTAPGTPVVIKIDADTLKIRITVTPFVRGKDLLLVVQGDVVQKDAAGVRKSTSLQSLHVPRGEDIAYFPLGRTLDGGRQMLVLLKVESPDE